MQNGYKIYSYQDVDEGGIMELIEALVILVVFFAFLFLWIELWATDPFMKDKEDRHYFWGQFWIIWGHYLSWAIPWGLLFWLT